MLDLYSYRAARRSLSSFLSSFKKKNSNKKKGCLIHGSTGIGKTTFVKNYCEENGYKYFEITESNVTKDILSVRTKFADFSNMSTNKNLVIIDSELNELNKSSRGFSTSLVKALNETLVPIVIILLEKPYGGSATTILKLCEVIRIWPPKVMDVSNVIRSYGESLGLRSIPQNLLLEISTNSKGDLNYAKNQVEFYSKNINKMFSKRMKDIPELNDEFKSFFVQENDKLVSEKTSKLESIFTIIKDMMLNCNTMKLNELIGEYFKDTFRIPLFFFENYPKYLKTNTQMDDLNMLQNISDSISYGDTISLKKMKTTNFGLELPSAYFTTLAPMKTLRSGRGLYPGQYLNIQYESVTKNNTKVNTAKKELKYGLVSGYEIVEYLKLKLKRVIDLVNKEEYDLVVKEFKTKEQFDKMVAGVKLDKEWKKVDRKKKTKLTKAFKDRDFKKVKTKKTGRRTKLKRKRERPKTLDKKSRKKGRTTEEKVKRKKKPIPSFFTKKKKTLQPDVLKGKVTKKKPRVKVKVKKRNMMLPAKRRKKKKVNPKEGEVKMDRKRKRKKMKDVVKIKKRKVVKKKNGNIMNFFKKK